MFKLTIVTPEKRVLVGQEVEELTVPAFKGELNILAGHAPLITTLETGVMKWKLKGKDLQETAVVSWGYLQVSPEGVNILANIIDTPEEINLETAKTKVAEIEAKAANELISEEDWKEFERQWNREKAKVEVAELSLIKK